jgi:hypothetical protein
MNHLMPLRQVAAVAAKLLAIRVEDPYEEARDGIF